MNRFARFQLLVGKFHDKNTVFRHQTNQHDDTDLREDVHRLTTGVHEHQCTEYRKGNGEHDDEGIAETFELCRQNEVDQHDGQAKGEEE